MNVSGDAVTAENMPDSNNPVSDRTITWLYYLAFPMMQLFLSLIVILGNALVIIAFFKYERLRTLTNYFVVNLAISDLTLVCGIWTCRTLHITEGSFSPGSAKIMCLVKFFFACMSFNCTMFNLLWIAVERYIKLFYALRYSTILTAKRVLATIIATWIGVIVMNVVSISLHRYSAEFNCNFSTVFHEIYGIYIFAGVAVPYLAAMMYIYCRIGWLTHQHRKRIEATEKAGDAKEQAKIRQKELQVAFMMFYIIIIVMIVYGLFIAVNVLGEVNGKAASLLFNTQVPKSADDYVYLETILYFGILFNSAINPFVYHWKSADFRRAFKDILGCGRKVDDLSSSSSGSSNSSVYTTKSTLSHYPTN